MHRLVWTVFGFLTQGVFGVTAVCLIWFLSGLPALATTAGPDVWRIAVDSGLSLLFALPHSLLLYPPVRRRITKVVPSPLYGCFFCTTTCLTALLLILFWQPFGVVFTPGRPALFVLALPYAAAWLLFAYSVSLTGFGYQTGWTPFLFWLRRQDPPRREFSPRGLYRFIRHPIYFSFLLIMWTPLVWSLDRFLLNAVWTIYVFVGSYLKDRRLEYYLGAAYRSYEAAVPGYPLLPGPLGRLRPGRQT